MPTILELPTGHEVFAAIPYIAARLIGAARQTDQVRYVVEHDMEAPESIGRARSTAGYFAGPNAGGSTQISVDNTEAVRSVPDDRRCAGAPGLNIPGVHIEHAGYARQTRDEWLDPYSDQMLWNSAKVTASYCTIFNLPVQFVGADEIARNAGRGITSHWEGTKAGKINPIYRGDHTDPGPNFPWDHYLGRVSIFMGHATKPVVPPQVFAPEVPSAVVWPTLRLGARGNMVLDLQRKLQAVSGKPAAIDGSFGPATQKAVVDYQKWCHLGADGIVGPATWKSINTAMWLKAAG